jgi:hypothetical protein
VNFSGRIAQSGNRKYDLDCKTGLETQLLNQLIFRQKKYTQKNRRTLQFCKVCVSRIAPVKRKNNRDVSH